MQNKKFLTLLSIVLLMGFMIMAMGSASTDTDTAQTEKAITTDGTVVSTEPVIAYTLPSTQLWKEYDANEVAADQKYKGQFLKVSGTVDNIGKDVTDTIYVSLKGDGYFGTVQCMMSDKYVDQAAALSKGQTITITGKCKGKVITTVVLDGCVIVK